MRERQHLVIDRATGDATLTTELVDADARQRMAELKAALPEPQPGDTCLACVLCDGCGARAEVDFGNPRMPDGWASTEDGDFCPRCQSLN